MLQRDQRTDGDDLVVVLRMADGLADLLTEYGSRRRAFDMKTWASFVEISHTVVMEIFMIQYEANAGNFTLSQKSYCGSSQIDSVVNFEIGPGSPHHPP